jgi:cell shape-determining protein MreC
VVKPVRSIAEGLSSKEKPIPPGEKKHRGDSELAIENESLRRQVAWLNKQLDELKLVEAERRRMGDLLDYCVPVRVMAGDASSTRESITLAPLSGVSMPAETPVLYADGLVGRIAHGSRVRLVTDPNFTVIGEFGRYEDGQWKSIQTAKASVVGAGGGKMMITHLPLKDIEQLLRPGDWVILNDESYPQKLKGAKLGQIEQIRPLSKSPLFAEITVRPKVDLRVTLREVMVMTGRGAVAGVRE